MPNHDDPESVALAFWTQVAWSHEVLPHTSRLLLLAVAFLANPAGNVTVIDGTLAGLMRLTTKTVARARKNCERRGVVEIQPESHRRQGAREGLTYQLVVCDP